MTELEALRALEVALAASLAGDGYLYDLGKAMDDVKNARERQAPQPQPAREAPQGRGGPVDDGDQIPFSACKE